MHATKKPQHGGSIETAGVEASTANMDSARPEKVSSISLFGT